MKQHIATLICICLTTATWASDLAHINIRISTPVKHNKYFLCVYSVGCLSIRAGNQGKAFATHPVDLGNIAKFVIADTADMSVAKQPSVESCNVMVNRGQQVTIKGELVVKNNVPKINHLRCIITS